MYHRTLATVHSLNQKLIVLAERAKEKNVPFSGLLLLYLRIPWYYRIGIGLVLGWLTVRVYYLLGYIVLQSQAKDEVLSIITAFQNPIEFQDSLVYKYSVFFCLIVLFALLPFPGAYFFYRNMRRVGAKKLVTKKDSILYNTIPALIGFLAFVLFVLFVLIVAPYILYIMLYKSQYSSLLEYAIRRVMGEYVSLDDVVVLSSTYLSSRIKYSVILGEWILVALIAFILALRSLAKKIRKPVVEYLYICLLPLISLAILLTLVTHTFYIPGYFGKAISNYDLDYVSVDFELEGLKHVEGIRIYESSKEMIIRDTCGVTHKITSPSIHVKTIQQLAKCEKPS